MEGEINTGGSAEKTGKTPREMNYIKEIPV